MLSNGLPHLFSVPQYNLSLGCKTADEVVNDLDPNENLPAALSGEVVEAENSCFKGEPRHRRGEASGVHAPPGHRRDRNWENPLR